MKRLSIGKIRGLQQVANKDGIFVICAMDHRGSLQSMINREHPEQVSYDKMVERKLELCSTLGKYASAVLLDPIYGAAQCISHSALPNNIGLLVSIEASGYNSEKEGRLTKLLENWTVKKIKQMGASAVKILVYYRPDLKQIANKQMNTVNTLAQECIKYDIPFLVEPVSYPIGEEAQDPVKFAQKKEELTIKIADDITALPIDVLKTEFPADLQYQKDESALMELCRRLDASSQVPWAILSRGVTFELFQKQVEIACRAGASGFVAGRAIWQEAMYIDNAQERVHYLSTIASDRLKKITDIANKYATPWYKKLSLSPQELTQTSEKWYKEF